MRSAHQPKDLESEVAVRFVEADAATFLEQLSNSRLVQAGAVNLIGLDAIRDRLGERWARRQADIWLNVEHSIGRLIADRGFFRRVSETDFVIAIAGVGAAEAQALCLKVLTETLTHFLGVCAERDVVIRNVSSVGPNQIGCVPVEIGALPNLDQVIAVPRDAAPADAAACSPAFSSATGLSLIVGHVLEPFINLRNGRVAGMCAEPIVRDGPTGRRLPGFVLSRLPDADLAQIDSRGLAFAQKTPTVSSRAQSLLVPLSFQTLSSSKLRAAALAELKVRRLNSAWIVILSHIDHGTPPSRLTEMAAFLRPYCGAVFASVPPTSPSFGYLSECRFQGLVIDLERWADEPDRVAHYLQVFGEKAVGLAGVLAVRGLTSEAPFETARAAGLTHASVRTVTQGHGRAG